MDPRFLEVKSLCDWALIALITMVGFFKQNLQQQARRIKWSRHMKWSDRHRELFKEGTAAEARNIFAQNSFPSFPFYCQMTLDRYGIMFVMIQKRRENTYFEAVSYLKIILYWTVSVAGIIRSHHGVTLFLFEILYSEMLFFYDDLADLFPTLRLSYAEINV